MSQVVEKCFNRAYKKCMPAEESDSEEEYVVRACSSSRRGANSEPEAHHHRPQRMASSRAIAAIHWNNEELQVKWTGCRYRHSVTFCDVNVLDMEKECDEQPPSYL